MHKKIAYLWLYYINLFLNFVASNYSSLVLWSRIPLTVLCVKVRPQPILIILYFCSSNMIIKCSDRNCKQTYSQLFLLITKSDFTKCWEYNTKHINDSFKKNWWYDFHHKDAYWPELYLNWVVVSKKYENYFIVDYCLKKFVLGKTKFKI